MICEACYTVYNVGRGRESGGARRDNIKEHLTLKLVSNFFQQSEEYGAGFE